MHIVRRLRSSLMLRAAGLVLVALALSQCADRCSVFSKGYPLCGI